MAQRVASKIRSRGARGLVGLARSFKIIDDDNSGQLSNQEFAKALRDYRIASNPEEVQAIIEIFDHDKSGQISYDEFLRTIVGEMNDFRRDLAIQAFKKMDANGDGVLDINDVRINYSAKKHPDVMMGKQTEDDILYEFLDTFEAHYAIKNPGSRDGVVELKEWLEYYNTVSCNIDLDEYFELMMKNCYKL
jgi:Ca2+-binding EF-hand superfamily protein